MTAVTVLALETALASSVSITLDVLAMANNIARSMARSDVFEVRLVGAGAPLFRPFLACPEPTAAISDILIVPAQGFSKADNYAVRLAEPDALEARAIVVEAAAQGTQVACSCTGTLLVANAGLLNGRRATTAWWLAPAFHELFPSVRLETAELVLTDGAVTTAGAAMAQMDLMVRIVARYAGAEIAEQCARKMVLDERRSQVPYMAIGLLAESNEAVARAASWARARLGEGIGVSDLARAVGQSPRTFARRVSATTGLSPIQFLQQIRVERAMELIETTGLPFEEIAYQVGYADPSTLRMLIRRGAGTGPRELRAQARNVESTEWRRPPGLALISGGARPRAS